MAATGRRSDDSRWLSRGSGFSRRGNAGRGRANSGPLPMLAILKVIAWSERHTTAPRKDAADLLLILKSYLDAGNQQRLYDEAAHLLDQNDFDYERAGAWLAGQDAAAAIQGDGAKQTPVHQRISTILTKEVDPDGRLRLIGEIGGRGAENIRLLLAAFLRGFNGEQAP